jgi:hypothetical protein
LSDIQKADGRVVVIWKERNDRIFNNGGVVIDETVDRIKAVSWEWFIGRAAKGPSSL